MITSFGVQPRAGTVPAANESLIETIYYAFRRVVVKQVFLLSKVSEARFHPVKLACGVD
jgi:hypothetical protein